jgi:hypothetical protein
MIPAAAAMITRWRNLVADSHFWDRKLRIAVLTLATFIALC